MSDTPKESVDLDALMAKVVANFRAAGLSDSKIAELLQSMTDWSASDSRFAIADFAIELRQRQGTVFPDFDRLYRRKAEIDRKFSV